MRQNFRFGCLVRVHQNQSSVVNDQALQCGLSGRNAQTSRAYIKYSTAVYHYTMYYHHTLLDEHFCNSELRASARVTSSKINSTWMPFDVLQFLYRLQQETFSMGFWKYTQHHQGGIFFSCCTNLLQMSFKRTDCSILPALKAKMTLAYIAQVKVQLLTNLLYFLSISWHFSPKKWCSAWLKVEEWHQECQLNIIWFYGKFFLSLLISPLICVRTALHE